MGLGLFCVHAIRPLYVLYIFMERILSLLGIAVAAVIVAPVVGLGIATAGALWPVVPVVMGMGAAVHLAGGTKDNKDSNNK